MKDPTGNHDDEFGQEISEEFVEEEIEEGNELNEKKRSESVVANSKK